MKKSKAEILALLAEMLDDEPESGVKEIPQDAPTETPETSDEVTEDITNGTPKDGDTQPEPPAVAPIVVDVSTPTTFDAPTPPVPGVDYQGGMDLLAQTIDQRLAGMENSIKAVAEQCDKLQVEINKTVAKFGLVEEVAETLTTLDKDAQVLQRIEQLL